MERRRVGEGGMVRTGNEKNEMAGETGRKREPGEKEKEGS